MKRNSIILVICLLFLTPSAIDATEIDSLYQEALALPDSLSIKARINDLDIRPNPLRTFHSTQPMFIYLEMYHLRRNTYGRTKYEISYRIGRPKEEEIDPTLFFDLDLPEGELEIEFVDQPVSQPSVDETDLTSEIAPASRRAQ